MRKQFWFVLLICVALAVFGCKKKSPSTSEEKPADTQQSATAEPAAPPAPAPQPEKPSTPPAPAQTPTTAKAPPPAPKAIVLPAGTAIAIRTTNALSSESNKAGETFEASVAKPVVVAGVTVLPVGAGATGKITQSASAGRVKGEGTLVLSLVALNVKGRSYPVIADPVKQTAKSRGGRSAKMIGGGAGAGALIGGIAGGGKGAAIGAVAGGAAGTAGATMTGKRAVEVPAETVLSFRLTAPLKLQ